MEGGHLKVFSKDIQDSDDFNRERLAVHLSHFLLTQAPDRLPMVVGIFGSWGSGKTWFMNAMVGHLESNCDETDACSSSGKPGAKVVWFDPWKYERRQDVAAGLMYALLNRVADDTDDTALAERSTRTAIQIGKVMAALSVAVVDAKFGGLATKAANNVSDALSVGHEYQTEVDKVIEEAHTSISDWAGDTPVFVFVDDLDRCLPGQMIRLLEALQVFLVETPCVFILGVDRHALESAVESRFGKSVSGRQYLDKIIDLPFVLPPLSSTQIANKYSSLFEDLGLWNANIRKICDVTLANNPREWERLFNHCFAELAANDLLSNGRLADHFLGHAALYVLVAIVKMRYPKLYEAAVRDPHALQQFASLSEGVAPGEKSLPVLVERGAGGLAEYVEIDHPARQLFKALRPLGKELIVDDNAALNTVISMAEGEVPT
jgi:hypothetical protein